MSSPQRVLSSFGEQVRESFAVDLDERTVVMLGVITSTFFIGFGGGVIYPILPNLGSVLGISPFILAVIMSANRVSRLVANAPAGGFVDRIGTRTPFVLGVVIQGVATSGYVVAMLVAVPEALFMGARVVWGVGSAFVFAAGQTIAADISDGDSRGKSMGLIRGGVVFGFPAGVVLGGLLSELAGPTVAFAVATGFAFIASGLAYLTVPETHVEGSEETRSKPWEIHTGVPALTVGVVNFSVYFVYFGVLFVTLVVFLDAADLSIFGFGPQGTSGLFMGSSVIAAGGSMYVAGALSDRRGSRVPTLSGFLLVSSVGYVLLASTDSVLLLTAACVAIGVGQGGIIGPLTALLADLVPDQQMGRASGTSNLFGDIGGASAPVLSLPLADIVGFRPIYVACAVIPLVALAVLLAGVYRETGQFVPGIEG